MIYTDVETKLLKKQVPWKIIIFYEKALFNMVEKLKQVAIIITTAFDTVNIIQLKFFFLIKCI